MRGFYTIYGPDGPVTVENVITDKGKALILNYLAGDLTFWGDKLAIGMSETPALATDSRMGYEIARSFVNVTEASVSNNSVTLKATFPRDIIGDIYEIGLFSSEEHSGYTEFGAALSDFDPVYLETAGLTADATNSRIGERGASLTGSTSTTTVGSIHNLLLSLEGRNGGDIFTLGYYTNTSSNIEIRFYTSDTAYFTYSFTPSAGEGYKFKSWRKWDFTTTTGADWVDPVARIDFRLGATASGGFVTFDGMRIDSGEQFPLYGLVSRTALAAPIAKGFDRELDIEYTIQFGW